MVVFSGIYLLASSTMLLTAALLIVQLEKNQHLSIDESYICNIASSV
jgi:hypothetical protein